SPASFAQEVGSTSENPASRQSFETPPKRRRLLRTNGFVWFAEEFSVRAEEAASFQRPSRSASDWQTRLFSKPPRGRSRLLLTREPATKLQLSSSPHLFEGTDEHRCAQ